MSGILGKVYYQYNHHVEPEAVARMCATLTHRGPDEGGFYLKANAGLAMRRLSIIDFNTGTQPIHNEDRTVWAVSDGEIYNFQALRRDLEESGHRFYTRTDTEVIVHLYEQCGIDFARHLNGMFAIAVWDECRGQLTLARDRLGIKPLFFAPLPDRLLFASEIKAILADGLQPTMDLQALHHYLSLLYIPAPRTMYREIRKLEAGHIVTWRNRMIAIHRYWDLRLIPPSGVSRRSPADIQAELRGLLTDAVRSHLVSDVPLGAFLSGGLDSSTVVALMRRTHSGPVKTFSLGFKDPSYDEFRHARLVAERFETDHTEFVVTPDIADLVPRLAYYFDEPFADSSAILTYYLSQLARRHVTVALGGNGGDEVFAGYITYKAANLARLYNRLPGVLTRWLVPALVHRVPISAGTVSVDFRAKRFVDHALLEPGPRHFARKAFFDDGLKRAILSGDVLAALNGSVDTHPIFLRHYAKVRHRDRLNAFLYVDAAVYLPDNVLVKVDRMSMAHSLEVRVPFLDHRVVEFVFGLPGRLKMRGLGLKHLLRETMRGILPEQTLRRPKGAFNVPIAAWLTHELQPLVQHYLSSDRIRQQGIFNPEGVSRLVSDHVRGRANHSRSIWALLVFSLWSERWGHGAGEGFSTVRIRSLPDPGHRLSFLLSQRGTRRNLDRQ